MQRVRRGDVDLGGLHGFLPGEVLTRVGEDRVLGVGVPGAQDAFGVLAAMDAQEAIGPGMDRRGRDGSLLAEKTLQALLHFASGLVREGQRQNVLRADSGFPNEPGDPVGQDARLTAAGAADDPQRSLCVRHRRVLGFAQRALEIQLSHPVPTLKGRSCHQERKGISRPRS